MRPDGGDPPHARKRTRPGPRDSRRCRQRRAQGPAGAPVTGPGRFHPGTPDGATEADWGYDGSISPLDEMMLLTANYQRITRAAD